MDPTWHLAIRASEFEADAKYTPREQISQNIVRLQIAFPAIFNMKAPEGVEADDASGSVEVCYCLDGSASGKGLRLRICAAGCEHGEFSERGNPAIRRIG